MRLTALSRRSAAASAIRVSRDAGDGIVYVRGTGTAHVSWSFDGTIYTDPVVVALPYAVPGSLHRWVSVTANTPLDLAAAPGPWTVEIDGIVTSPAYGLTAESGVELSMTISDLTTEPVIRDWELAGSIYRTDTITPVVGANCADGDTVRAAPLVAGQRVWSDPYVVRVLDVQIDAAAWSVQEAAEDASTRRTLITTTAIAPSGKEWCGYRSTSLSDISGPISEIAGSLVPLTSVGEVFAWLSSGQTPLGGTGYGRIAMRDIGGGNEVWVTDVKSYVASDKPAALGALDWDLIPAAGGATFRLINGADGRGRTVTAYQYQIDGGAWTALPGGTALGDRTLAILGTTQVTLSVQSQNANGWSLSATKTVTPLEAPVEPDPAPTTMMTSYTFPGAAAAWIFSEAVPVGEYAMGDPFVISDTASTITAMGEPSVASGGYIQDGVMALNLVGGGGDAQGWDQLLAASVKPVSYPYSAALNIDPTAAGGAYAIGIGDEKMLVKAHRRIGFGTDEFGAFDQIHALTIVPAAKHPIDGDFRPPLVATDKTSFVNVSEIDRGCCLQIDISSLIGTGVNDVRSYAEVLADWRSPTAAFGEPTGEKKRVVEVFDHISTGGNHGSVISEFMWETTCHLHNGALSDAEWLELAKYVVQLAVDQCGAVELGQIEGPGAGQKHFYHTALMWGAALTGNARLWAAAQAMGSNFDQPRRVVAGMVGAFTAWPYSNQGGFYQYVQATQDEDLGKPFWCGEVEVDKNATAINQRSYLEVSGKGRWREAPPLLAVQANKLGDGLSLMLAGHADREALPQYLYRELKTRGWEDYSSIERAANYITSKMRDAYNLFEPHWGTTPELTWRPDMPLPFRATAGAAQIAWDYSAPYAAGYGSQTALTGIEVRRGQWSPVQQEVISTSAAASHAEVPGIPLYVSARVQNANGWGVWSHVDKTHRDATAPINYVTPTGTPTGTVTNDVAPALMMRRYPLNKSAIFVPAVDDLELGTPIYLGPGIWSGAVSGTPAYACQVYSGGSWVAAGGAVQVDGDAAYYSPAAAEAGMQMRSAITVNGVTAYSAAVALGTLPAAEPGVIIDTDFGYKFRVQYPTEYASLTAGNGTLSVQPAGVYGSIDGIGAVFVDKTAASPRCGLKLASLPAGTYDLEADVIVGYAPNGSAQPWQVDAARYGHVKIGTALANASVWQSPQIEETITRTIIDPDSGEETTGTITQYLSEQATTFTWPGGDCWITWGTNSSSAGTAGGDVGLKRLRIAVAA